MKPLHQSLPVDRTGTAQAKNFDNRTPPGPKHLDNCAIRCVNSSAYGEIVAGICLMVASGLTAPSVFFAVGMFLVGLAFIVHGSIGLFAGKVSADANPSSHTSSETQSIGEEPRELLRPLYPDLVYDAEEIANPENDEPPPEPL